MGDKHIVPEPPFWSRPIFLLLDEVPGALGQTLWQYARHLRDRTSVSEPQRSTLVHQQFVPHVLDRISAAKREVPQLAEALDRFGMVVLSPDCDDHDLARASETVVDWAESQGYLRCATEFAELAALLEPQSASAANRAGRLNRNASDFPRAEVWFERGIGLARRAADHVEYTRGHIGFGILFQTLGKDRRARKHFHTAAVIARKDGRRWLAAEAQHDLMLMSTERGRFDEAEVHAARALTWYPKHHRRFPFFVADLCFLLVCEAHYSVAVELLTDFLDVVENPAQQVLGMSLLARALACAGRRSRFIRVRGRVQTLLNEFTEHEPAARVNIAEAERAAGLWRDAEATARAALELAIARRDVVPERLARALLVEIQQRTPPPVESRTPHRDPEWLSNIVPSVSTRLAAWTPTRRGRIPTVGRSEWAAA